jgi:hypothetical protein
VRDLMGLDSVLIGGNLAALLARLAMDLAFITITTFLVHYRLYRNREHLFTCHLFNLVTLCLCVLLRKGPAELGFGLTLFGVFGILRYRTEQIRSRDLTYLLVAIGIGLINGAAGPHVSVAELLVANGVVVAMVVLLEVGWRRSREVATPMLYDRLELLQPGREAALVADIVERTGLAVLRVETRHIDLLRDTAEITVYCGPRTTTGRGPEPGVHCRSAD